MQGLYLGHNAHQTQRTLAEQLRITDADIKERKDLLGLSPEVEAQLTAIQGVAREIVDDVVDEFYEHQVQVPKIRSIIGDSDTLARLRAAMRGYVLKLFSGDYRSDYVNSRLRIGKVHARIGVPPKLYVSSLHELENIIRRHLLDRLGEAAPQDALHKLMLFDLQFVFDTYIQGLVTEVEAARDEMINYSRTLEDTVAQRTAQIDRLAHTDELTGLWNRRSLFSQAERELQAAQRQNLQLSIAFLDIDSFKDINDSEGHLRGDQILKEIGRVILDGVRSSDLAFRYGGDEFCLVLPGASEAQALRLCGVICEAVREALGGAIRMSAGVATFNPGDVADVEALIAQADSRMYRAKTKSAKGAKGAKAAAPEISAPPAPATTRTAAE